jgi:oligopeptide transport system substrate-binding protein
MIGSVLSGAVGRCARVIAVSLAASFTATTVASTTAAPEKVIRIPIRTDGPKSLDPVKGSTQYDNQACGQVYETLLQWKYLVRPLELEPLLLTGMPTFTDNPDGTRTWKFHLKPGVRFQDDPCFPGGKGRELVTRDVFYSWKRLADPAYEYENWWLVEDTIVGFDEYKARQRQRTEAGQPFDYEAPVAGFREVNDHEFEVVLTKPVYRFMYTLTQFQLSIVPREAVEKYREVFSRHPVGTGPYTVSESDWKPGEFLILKRNPGYHECVYPSELPADAKLAERDRALGFDRPAGRRIPFVDRVEITFYVQDQPMWLDFDSRKIDFTQVPAEYFDKAFVRRTRKLRDEYASRGVVDHTILLLDFIFRGFNMEDPVVGGYDDRRRKLRQSISLAYDQDSLNASFYNGLNIVYDGPIPPGLDGYPPEGQAPENYRGPDIEGAKRLLAAAGYPGGKGLAPLEYYTSRGGNQAEQTQAEQRMLDAIGIKLNTHLVDFSELIDAINKKKAQFFSFAWGSDYPDAENNLALFYSKNKAPGSNHYNYDNPEYDRLYERIIVMPPGPERTALYEKMRDMIIEDAPFVGSMARYRFYLVNPRLKNFKPTEDFHNWVKYLDVDDSPR